MKSISKQIVPLLLLFIVASCGKDGQKKTMARPQAMPLPVIEIPVKTVTSYTIFPANIEGIVNSEVRAKISGYITDVLVDEGQKVRKGQPLFKLETQAMNQDAAAAKANVNAAQVEVDKLKPLVEKNIISPIQLETAKAKLQQAKSSYNSIVANIGYGTITSPVDGYVGEIRLRKGALVSPSNQHPLTTVSDISSVYAYFSVNEKNYIDFLQNTSGTSKEEKIKNAPKVTLILANGTEYSEKGTIQTINSQVAKNTGTVSIRAQFNNPNGILTNGNSGVIKIPMVHESVVVVPQESTFEKQQNRFVYVIKNDSTNTPVVTSKSIKVRGSSANLFIVESGIGPGEIIVAKGIGKVREGMPITPQKIEFDTMAQPIKKEFQ